MYIHKNSQLDLFGIFNSDLDLEHQITVGSFQVESARKLIRSGKHLQKEFILLDKFDPSKPKHRYFSCLFFYEPLLLDSKISESKLPQLSSFSSDYIHPLKHVFPSKFIYFFPKLIVIQSRKPCFWLLTKLLLLFYRLVFSPYIKGTPAIRIMLKNGILNNSELNGISGFLNEQPSKNNSMIDMFYQRSTIKEKDFILSYLFSFRIPKEPYFSLRVSLANIENKLLAYRYFGSHLNEELFDVVSEIVSSKSRLMNFIILFHCILVEEQIYVYHNRPGIFFNLIEATLHP